MVIKEPSEHHWTINGRSYPHTDPLMVRANHRYHLIFDNQSALAHPMHLHRHTFELTHFVDKATSGVHKGVVVPPGPGWFSPPSSVSHGHGIDDADAVSS
jgi:FtsP/CotA-like multicopper oxidase with cupredoxin domain